MRLPAQKEQGAIFLEEDDHQRRKMDHLQQRKAQEVLRTKG